jgi:hypothetical protein
MAKLPEKTQQIAQVHAQLIHSVVMACHNPDLLPQLEPVLKSSEDNGWVGLINRIRKILGGNRNTQLLIGLDEEDAAIILAILVGLQDPEQLPRPVQSDESHYAASGLAAMIDAAGKGDAQALALLGDMAQQMVAAPGTIRQLGGIMRALINGERDINVLNYHMDEKGIILLEALLDELARLNPQ